MAVKVGGMRFLTIQFVKLVLELFLVVFSAWTLAYHITLLFHLPAFLIILPFIAILSAALVLSRRHWSRRWQQTAEGEAEGWLFLISFGMAAFALLHLQPDPDDLGFFHRVLFQLSRLNSPFVLTDTEHNVAGLPPLSILHVMTSYEPMAGLLGWALHLKPLWMYEIVMGCVGSALIPIVYTLLYREFGLGARISVLATVVSIVFLLFDGSPMRAFGSVAMGVMWVGKAIVWILLVPATMLAARAYLRAPGRGRWLILFMLGVSGVGLSNTGVYMLPLLVLVIGAVHLAQAGRANPRSAMIGAGGLWLSMIYPVAIGAAVAFGLLGAPMDPVTIYMNGWPSNWVGDLGLVIPDIRTLIRDAVIIFGLPIVALSRSNRMFLLLCWVGLVIVFANPIMGPLWMKLIYPASYWRLLFLFPLPWCAGLAIPAIARVGKIPAPVRYLVVCAAIASSAFAFKKTVPIPVIGPTRHIRACQFPPEEKAFSESISESLTNRNVLAPADIVVVLGLMNPTITFETTRGAFTVYAFVSAGQPGEGQRRLLAQGFVTNCVAGPGEEEAALQSLRNGVDGLIVTVCDEQSIARAAHLLGAAPGRWVLAGGTNRYALFLKED